MSADTVELAQKMARVQAARDRRKHLERMVDRRNICLVLALVACVVALLLSFGHWFHKIEVPAGVISWLGPGLTTFFLIGALALQVAVNQRHTTDEIRDARPVDTVVLGEMMAEVQANREMIRLLRGDIAANERQRRSDFDQVRDNSRKAVEGIHQQMERIAGSVPQLIAAARAEDRVELEKVMEDALKKERAAGYVAGVQQRLNGSSGTVVAFPKA